uniref:CSON008007 protein n=1 Tax=Culicoides sonorensis TaxID=179676 RepID=A0A336KH81_CULSO
MDLNTACRGCLTETDTTDFFNLDEIGLIDRTYRQMLEEVSGYVIITETEPNRLCENCGIVLLETFKFKQTLNETQDILGQLMEQGVTEEKITVEEIEFIDQSMQLEEVTEGGEEYGVTIHTLESGKTIQEIMETGEIEGFDKDGVTYIKTENKVLVDYDENKETAYTLIEQNKVSCPYCDVLCSTNQSLHRHMTNQHPNVKPEFVCSYCEKSYHFREWLENHERQCPGVRAEKDGLTEFACKFCEKRFKTYRNMRNHISMFHHDQEKQTEETSRNIQCSFCTTKLKNIQTLRHHMQNVHSNMKNLKCAYCDVLSYTPELLQAHMTKCKGYLEKMESSEMVCPYCPVVKLGKKKLNAHIVACHTRHTNEKKDIGQCDICKKLLQKSSLNRHILDKHTTKSPLTCPYCSEIYKSESGLQYHISQYHSILKTFNCDICDFETTQKHLLKRHLKRHNPDKSFICTECGRVRFSLNHLKAHMISHSDEKPWKCNLCEKSYKRKEKLKQHVDKFHENKTNYECPVCAEEFFRNETLRQHIGKCHPDYELPPKGTVMHKAKEKKFMTKIWKRVEKVFEEN